jgi:hypothetical protein
MACLLQGCRADERWIDEALLADGRTVEVDRSVSFNFGRGELTNALTRWPNQYAFSTKNPDSGKSVLWSGEQDFNPILLDFSNKTPYLVVVATSVFSNLKQYGCPKIPYIFFRFDESGGHWNQIAPKDFPSQLLHANLSFHYDGTYMKDGARQTKEDIDSRNTLGERSSENFTTRTIPTDFASWSSRYKNQYRVGHYHDGCRHTVPSNEDQTHPQAPGQPSQDMALEVLENKVYEPEWIIKGDSDIQFRNWNDLAWDEEKSAKCRALIRRVGDDTDKPELRGWLLFNNDPTGTNKALDPGSIFCDAEMMWFVDYGQNRQRVILTKFTIRGDFVYKLSFQKPDAPGGYLGGIMQPTFQVKNGYLYFEWWNTNQSGWNRHIKRSMKVRVREPQPVTQATNN